LVNRAIIGIISLVLLAGCAAPEMPSQPPQPSKASSRVPEKPPPPPPPPDYSFAPAPKAIVAILDDPETTIEALILTSETRPGETFRGFSVLRRKKLEGVQRDQVAAALTSAVTYGHLSMLCSSAGIGFHMSSLRRGMLDVWIDPSEGQVEILGESPQQLALSSSGIRLFSEISRQLKGERGCP
jgi:hypothetical protein